MSRRARSLAFAIVAVAALTPAVSLGAQTLDRNLRPVPGKPSTLRVPSWTRVTLSNGAQLVVTEKHDLPLVAFAISFMEALWMEMRGTGVKTLVVNPGPVKTEWQEVAGYDENTPIPPGMITAERCVKDALRAYDQGKRSTVTGTFFPWFMRAAVGPKGVKLRVAERMYRPRD